jgi:aminodeoxyfutalosine synthase
MTTALADIAARLAAGDLLTAEDARRLADTADIIPIGMLADDVRRRRHGRRATFVRVADVPVVGPPPATAGPYPRAAGELRLVGTPADLDAAAGWVRALTAAAGGLPVTGFLLSDLVALAARERRSLQDALEGLRDAGLALVAEAPLDLLDSGKALEAAVAARLPVARVTLQQAGADAVAICRRVADLQRATGAVRAFAPLPRRLEGPPPSTGYDDVKRVALARLLVTNVASIQVDWTLYGPKLAQVALTFGADDLDGVLAVDHLELGARRRVLDEIRRNIRAASLEPVERDGRFELRPPS